MKIQLLSNTMHSRNYVKILNTKKKSGISDNFTTLNTPNSKKLHKSRRRRLKEKKIKALALKKENSKSSTTSIDKTKSDSFSITIEEPKPILPKKILQRAKKKVPSQKSVSPVAIQPNALLEKPQSNVITNVSPKQQTMINILSTGTGKSVNEQKLSTIHSKSVGSSPNLKVKKRIVKPTVIPKVPKPPVLPPGCSGEKRLQPTNLSKKDKIITKNNDFKFTKEWNEKCDAFMKMLDEIDTNNIFEDIVPNKQLANYEIPTEINLGIFSKSIWDNSITDYHYNDGWDKVLNRDRNNVSNPYSKENYYSNNPFINF